MWTCLHLVISYLSVALLPVKVRCLCVRRAKSLTSRTWWILPGFFVFLHASLKNWKGPEYEVIISVHTDKGVYITRWIIGYVHVHVYYWLTFNLQTLSWACWLHVFKLIQNVSSLLVPLMSSVHCCLQTGPGCLCIQQLHVKMCSTLKCMRTKIILGLLFRHCFLCVSGHPNTILGLPFWFSFCMP